MATITFQAGQLTSTITASNAKAATVFRNAALHKGYQGDIGDNQAVADFVMEQIKHMLTDWSRDYQEGTDVRIARNAARANTDIRFDD